MAGRKLSDAERREIEEMARGWGKILANAAFPERPGLDVDLWTMEEIAATASKSLVRGAVETMTEQQSQQLPEEHACPQCGRLCPLEHRSRAMQVRGGRAEVVEPVGHCSTCRRDFFPDAYGVEDRRASV